MRDGRRLDTQSAAGDIESVRSHALAEVSALPDHVRGLDNADPPYPVEVSEQLQADRDRILSQVR